jgi:hypothetical protein
MSQMWWLTPVIPATQEVEAGGSQFEASIGKVRVIESEKQNTNKSTGWLK